MNKLHLSGLIVIFFLAGQSVKGQVELEPWGNITGIRVQGQLMAFESAIQVRGKDDSFVRSTGKEKQRPRYTREGDKQIVNTRIDSLYFTEEVSDIGTGLVSVHIICKSSADTSLNGIFYHIHFPAAPHRRIEITGEKNIRIDDTSAEISIPIHLGDIKKDQEAGLTFTIKVTGDIDRTPIHLSLNRAQTGRPFDGMGGNFRIQNPTIDPSVIDYNLQHLRVAWARVEFPWRSWQPGLADHPVDSALAGKMAPAVQRAIAITSRLGKQGIPLILSAWFPPDWAITGTYKSRPGPDGIWGNPLDPSRMEDIYASITSYILYLKKSYGVEIRLFSFNESDLGINVRVSALEHAALIKGLGAYFAAHGLETKMLLGDNSDATTYAFIDPAMNDAEAIPYIGAVSFHSWRGCDTANLEKWADAATRLKLPLIVAEGSIDAAAWNYPAIFQEQTYALKEISLYTRLLAICQPISILQWQLTTDYSLLTGGGMGGDKGPLSPTQRFWNLKQLGATPPGLLAIPVACDRPDVACAAMGDNAKGVYALHLVNNGATRAATLSGLPKTVKYFRVYITNKDKAFYQEGRVAVSKGVAHFTLDALSYVSLISE